MIILHRLLLGDTYTHSMVEVDVMIEQSVASMQVVIELGRVIRDRKVMPVKVLCVNLVCGVYCVHVLYCNNSMHM